MEPLLTVVSVEQVTQNPLTFTSTFSIPATALIRRVPQPDGPEIKTDRCGLGWTFEIQAHQLAQPPVPNGILQPVFAAARNKGRLTIVDFSGQDSISVSDSYSNAKNLIVVRAHFDSSQVAFAGNLGIKHISCTLRAPGPEGVTRSCDKVLVAPAETVPIGTFSYEYTMEGGGNGEEGTFIFTFAVEIGNAHSENKTTPQQVEGRAATALADSIRTGCMVDTKFYLYSKKASGGGASHPKEIYASSAILRGFSDDMDVLLASHGFQGSETVPLDLFELKEDDMETEEYDYPDEDSDLESEELPYSPVPTRSRIMNLPSDAPVSVDQEGSPHLVGSESRESIQDGDGDKAKPTNEDLTVALTHVQTVTDKNFLRKGRVIVIKDTAFATWEALIRYIYFNEVHFNSLGAGLSTPGGCSPKSMYRLADKFGIATLKDLALQNIKTQMSVQNITREVFSRFSSLYPEILHPEIEYLLNHYADSNVQTGISQVLQTTVTGEHSYRLDAVQRVMTGLTAQVQSLTKPNLCRQSLHCNYCYSYHYR